MCRRGKFSKSTINFWTTGWQTHWGCSRIGVIRWWWTVLFGHWGHFHVLMITLTPVICHIQSTVELILLGTSKINCFYMQQKGVTFLIHIQFAIWTPAWGRKNQTLTNSSDRVTVAGVWMGRCDVQVQVHCGVWKRMNLRCENFLIGLLEVLWF